MDKKLFEISSCYNEGYYGAEDLFWANSKLDVANHILKEIKEYLENKENKRGERYFHMLRNIDAKLINSKKGYQKIRANGFRWDSFEKNIFIKRMYKITGEELLQIMEGSYVDGDSNAQVSIHEYDPKNIITLC